MARVRWPTTTLARLEQGRSLYVRRCAGCHMLKDPSAVAADVWPAKIAKMEREHEVRLAHDEAELIAGYLYAMSRRTPTR